MQSVEKFANPVFRRLQLFAFCLLVPAITLAQTQSATPTIATYMSTSYSAEQTALAPAEDAIQNSFGATGGACGADAVSALGNLKVSYVKSWVSGVVLETNAAAAVGQSVDASALRGLLGGYQAQDLAAVNAFASNCAIPQTVMSTFVTSIGIIYDAAFQQIEAIGNPLVQSGYWWNPAESGRGFVIETRGLVILVTGFLYSTSGEATWVMSTGQLSTPTHYSGLLNSYAGGQTLTGPYGATPLVVEKLGTITLDFFSSTTATLAWPGGTIPIQRFDFGPGGSETPQPAGTVQTGVWWNPNESGRGFTLEVQGGVMFLAGYMYDDAGNPVWYVATGSMTNALLFQGQWSQFGDGQTLTGGYQPPLVANSNVGSVTLQFTSPTSATLTLPTGNQIPLIPFTF
jgi:hypothetical protein